MATDKESILSSFLSITGCEDVTRSEQLLSKCSWNLESALGAYFDSGFEHLEESSSYESSPLAEEIHSPPTPLRSSNNTSNATSSPNSNVSPVTPANRTPHDTDFSFLSWIFKAFYFVLDRLVFFPLKSILSWMQVANRTAITDNGNEIQLTDFKTQFLSQYEGMEFIFDSPGCVSLTEELAISLAKAKNNSEFLLVYIHQPSHGDVDSFVRSFLGSHSMREFITASATNNLKIWIGSYQTSRGKQAALDLTLLKFPFIALVSPVPLNSSVVRNGISCLIEEGNQIGPADQIVGRWQAFVANQSSLLVQQRREREERETARLLREQQNEAYQASLAADREKARQAQQKKLEEESRKQAILARRNKRKDAQANRQSARDKYVLPAEPDSTATNICRISIRYSNGARQTRKFFANNTLQNLFEYVEKSGNIPLNVHYCICSHFPRTELVKSNEIGLNPGNKTLEEAGLTPSANLFVEEIDDSDYSSSGEILKD